ncbi:5'/3'-nucleotidase SurE [Arenicella xantha]|nr:5'/3'-nucleotidase SurE [Arenicella xantha]
MHILISNDDGFDAPGLAVLHQALKNQYHRVTVVAPKSDRSGCGMGISLRQPVAVERVAEDQYVVDGTPVDCVYLGLLNLVDEPVDLVICGINNGTNLADDVFYSGTFAGAMEARFLAMPAIALSVTERNVQHYETAAYLAVQMVNAMSHLHYRSLISVLNVNVPDVPAADLRGYKATVLGEREAPLISSRESGDGDNAVYRLGAAGPFRKTKRSKMQDFEAVAQGFASITPLSARFADSAYVDDVQVWLDEM